MNESLTGSGLSRDADTTLTEQLAARFAGRIRQRLLAPGARLPSVRECARRHGVSPYTVVAAYDQLLAQGLVEARRQRGFFVRDTSAAPPRAPSAGPGVQRPLPISATTLLRGMFQPPGAQPMPGLGTLPVEWLDLPMLASAMRRVTGSARLGEASLQYGEPAGDPHLRRALAHKLADHGIDAAPEQIVTSVGATHALDIVTRSLMRAGDAVLVEEPGWPLEYARLAALGLRLLPVPRGESGPDLAVMQRLIEAHHPRLYVSVSVLHKPDRCVALARRGAPVAQARAGARPAHHRGRQLRPPRAGTPAATVGARTGWTRTIYVSGLLEDPGAELARGLPGRAEAAGRALHRRQAAEHAHHPVTDRAGAGALPGHRPDAAPRRPGGCQARRGPRPLGAAGRSAWLPLRRAAARAVRLSGCGRRHRTPRPRHAGRRLAARAGRPVSRDAASDPSHAHQLRQYARPSVLARARQRKRCRVACAYLQRTCTHRVPAILQGLSGVKSASACENRKHS